jgi:hypothetical protein
MPRFQVATMMTDQYKILFRDNRSGGAYSGEFSLVLASEIQRFEYLFGQELEMLRTESFSSNECRCGRVTRFFADLI